MLKALKVVASPSAWLPVALEFQVVDAGEFETATRTPLRKAAKPSSYFIFKVSSEIAGASATSKRTRR